MGIETLFAVGALILLGALVYGVNQYRKRDPAKEAQTEAATRDLYKTTER